MKLVNSKIPINYCFRSGLLLLGFALIINQSHAEVRYIVKDLDTVRESGNFSTGWDINNLGQVVGRSDDEGGVRTFITNGSGIMSDLFTNTPYSYPDYITQANGINNLGQVTGFIWDLNGNNYGDIVSYTIQQNGHLSILQPVQGSDYTTRQIATDINDVGHITGGYWRASDQTYRAFRSDNQGNLVDLDPTDSLKTILGYSGVAINNAGQIIGTDTNDPGDSHISFYTKPDGELALVNGFGGSVSVNSINDLGQVTGSSSFSPDNYFEVSAFINDLTTNTAINLDPDGKWYASYGSGINNSGVVVGSLLSAPLQASSDYRAFVTVDGVIVDLNTLLFENATGMTLLRAEAINDLGQITGEGLLSNGEVHAFLLTPVTVPLPAASCLFLSGLMGLFCHKPKGGNRFTVT